MNTEKHNEWNYHGRSKDAARLNMLMRESDERREAHTRPSIPMPSFDRGEEETRNVRGAMTLESYQRLRKGYERGINPEALERMEEQRESAREESYQQPSYSYDSYEETPASDVREHGYQSRNDYHTDYPVEHTEHRPSRRSRRMGPIAVMLVLLIGIVGALLLYAGGIEYISELFRSGDPTLDENLTLVTERPRTEQEIDPTQTSTPGEEMAMTEADEIASTESIEESENVESLDRTKEKSAIDPAVAANREAEAKAKAKEVKTKVEPSRRDETIAAKEKTAPASETPKKTQEKAPAKSPATSTATPTTTATAPKTTPKVTNTISPASSGKKYAVQVRATPNKAEADRVARALRAKGGTDVHIVATEKDGEMVYRVRFGSFGSEAEGKSKAGEMGYGSVWVVKQ